MKNIKRINILFLIFLLVAGSIFAGGGNRRGTAGAAELLIPVGARGIAMGNATLMGSTGADAIYWNPAGLARTNNGVDVLASHMTYLADIDVTYGAVGFKVGGFGTLGFSIKSLSIGDILKTTTDFPDGTGQTFSPQYMIIGGTFSKMLSDRVSVGITMNYISEKMDLVSTSGMSFDIGVSYQNLGSIEGLGLALAMKNLGSDLRYDGSGLFVLGELSDALRPAGYTKLETASFELPSTLDIGLSYDAKIDEVNNLLVVGTFTNHNFYEDEYKFGAEYSYDNTFFVRGGYVLVPELEDDETVYSFTAGAGLNYQMGDMSLKVDYAFRAVDLPTEDGNHIFTIGLGL